MDLLDPPARFRAASRLLKVGDRVSMSALLASWIEAGYESGPLVDGPGQVSRRGGILDVYPPSGPPTRIELFGDEIESIRVFDVETQRSAQRLTELRVTPARERPVDDPAAPTATFFDHLPDDAVVIVDEGHQLEMVSRDLEAQAEEVRMHHQSLGDLPARTLREDVRDLAGAALPPGHDLGARAGRHDPRSGPRAGAVRARPGVRRTAQGVPRPRGPAGRARRRVDRRRLAAVGPAPGAAGRAQRRPGADPPAAGRVGAAAPRPAGSR